MGPPRDRRFKTLYSLVWRSLGIRERTGDVLAIGIFKTSTMYGRNSRLLVSSAHAVKSQRTDLPPCNLTRHSSRTYGSRRCTAYWHRFRGLDEDPRDSLCSANPLCFWCRARITKRAERLATSRLVSAATERKLRARAHRVTTIIGERTAGFCVEFARDGGGADADGRVCKPDGMARRSPGGSIWCWVAIGCAG
jgi:hypothetical protein